jgi:two-component system chemotaxis response regulator CheB
VLVVDDSAYNRRTIADVFSGATDVEVVGKAADGEEALLLATLLKPDVITLDLEMPRMDGFTFLRILMAKQPTPVIVVSSYSQKENVFKALELGALDFVAKPDQRLAPGGVDVKDEILTKVRLLRAIRPSLFPRIKRPAGAAAPGESKDVEPPAPPSVNRIPPKQIVAIGSSTGGPSALLEIFAKIPATTPAGFVVAQHMPDKFTRTFAERIARRGAVRMTEGQDGDVLVKCGGFVCPGRQCMELVPSVGIEFRVKVGPAKPTDRYVPSVDRLLTSAAKAAGSRAIGVVLTGMGDDGLAGARAIHEAGGLVIAESAETAVVYGMPGSVVRAGLAHKVLPLGQIADYLASLA